MGNAAQREAELRNTHINMALQDEAAQEKRTIKLLLLGPAESGKSTVLKQMRIMHSQGFTDEEIRERMKTIYATVIRAMAHLIQNGSTLLQISLTESAKLHAEIVMKANTQLNLLPTVLDPSVAKALLCLSKLRPLIEMIDDDNLCSYDQQYFLKNIERICNPGYVPSSQDLVILRVPTSGIIEVRFPVRQVIFRVVDVGGQRSERKKWIHCFEGVEAIIFIVALNDYDLSLREASNTNRMTDALGLFDAVCNCRWFFESSFILFLNKKDLFAIKVRSVSLTLCFPEYTGTQDYDEAIQFMAQKFTERNQITQRHVFIHETCAADTEQIQVVLRSCIHSIISRNLRDAGIY